MKLKTLVETIELQSKLEDTIISVMKEAFIESFDILEEGEQDSAIMAACRSQKGVMLLTGTDDYLLVKALEKLRTTNWSTISTKDQCVTAIMNKLYNLKTTCDITVDNPKVKSTVINSMESLWKQAILKVAKYQISNPTKALQDLKTLFVTAFKKMKENI